MSLSAVIFVSLVTTAAGQPTSARADQSTTTSTQATSTQATATSTSAQAAPGQGQPAGQGQPEALPVSLDRIRKALDNSGGNAADAPKLRVDTSHLPVFRTHTESTGIPLSSILDDGTNVGAYVRPPNGPYDYEFKQMVTPDAVKGCGRLTQTECLQSLANQLATGYLWQRATQKKATAPSTPPPPDAETLRIRAQIQQELLDRQSAASAQQPATP